VGVAQLTLAIFYFKEFCYNFYALLL